MSNRNKNTINNKNRDKGNSRATSNATQNNKNKQAMKEMDDPKFAKINKYNDGNDPDYYFFDKNLAEQAATFPFPYFLGTQKTIGEVNMPTACVLFFNPAVSVTPYVTTGGTSATRYQTGTNMAAQKLYTRLSVASGRTANYQMNDVMCAILAAISLMEGIEAARRFFGVATTYSVRNRVYAWRILSMIAGNSNQSFGVDFIEHMADYRMHLNMIITKINQIPFFGDLGITRKSMEMYQKIYLDDPSDLAQTYVYAPESLWTIDETGTTGTILKTTNFKGLATFQDWLDQLNDMADKLLSSTTLNMVYADMFNYQAKFSANFVTLDYVLEGYGVVPEYNERALQQIHNAVITGIPNAATGDAWITPLNDVVSQTNGMLKYNPGFPSDGITKGPGLIDFETSSPDLVDRIDGLKFMSLAKETHTTEQVQRYTNCALPDHYICEAYVYGARPEDFIHIKGNRYGVSGATSHGTPYFTDTPGNGDYSSYTSDGVVGRSAAMYTDLFSKFAKFMLGVRYTNNEVAGIVGDLTYFTTMDFDHFARVNELEYQGLFELR